MSELNDFHCCTALYKFDSIMTNMKNEANISNRCPCRSSEKSCRNDDNVAAKLIKQTIVIAIL